MNEICRLLSIRIIFLFLGLFFFSSCIHKSKTDFNTEESLIVGGPVHNYAVFNNDTIYEGGWDTGLKSIEIKSDTVVYDCSHLFHSYYWRWCGDSLWLLDTNVILIEINRSINYVDSNFWCLTDFNIEANRTDTSFFLSSSFQNGDTIFYQSSHWGLKEYWPIN